MTTATRTRVYVKPERRVTLGEFVGNIAALSICSVERRVRSEPKITIYCYFLYRLEADFGMGFRFEKAPTDRKPGEPDEYDVNLDLQRGYHSCTCKGNTYCGHCKHVESLLALIKAGKIPAPQQPVRQPVVLEDL